MTVSNMKRFVSVICFFGLMLLKDMADACNMTAVNTCTEILSRSSDASVITEGISAIPTVQQLKKLCGAMGDFKACYKPKAAECSGDVVFSMTFGTIENTIEYLCVEGYQDILQYATCWNQTEVIADSTKCHVTQNHMISALHNQQRTRNLTSTAMRNYWCNILDNTTACMRAGVQTRCGEEPGCIMHTMMSRALKGLAALMRCPAPASCQLHSDGSEHTHGDTHPDHRNASDRHSDGTIHRHGDILLDHSNDQNISGGRHSDESRQTPGDSHSDHSGTADAEGTANNQNNNNNKAASKGVSLFLSVVAISLFGANVLF